METRKLKLVLMGFGLIVLMGVGCSKNSPTSTGNSNSQYQSTINSGGTFPTVTPEDTVTSADTTVETQNNEQYFCTTKHYSVVKTPDNFPTFDPLADVVYPGNLLQGNSLANATPNPIPAKRAGGTIVMTILNGSPAASETIPVVDLGHVITAQNDIIARASNTVPARFTFTYEAVDSRKQLALALDVEYSNLVGNLGASLSFSQDKEYNRYVVKLVQSYFTMAFQLPTSIDEIFAPDETPQNLAKYIGPGNPAAFISSVTYGRIFYLLIESTSSKTEMAASIDASFNGAVTQGSLNGSATYVKDLKDVKVKAFAMGGEASAAIGAITTDFTTLKQYLAQGGQINTGVPLSYVVRSLANPSQIVKVGLATEYDVTDCELVSSSVPNPIFWYRIDDPKYFSRGSGSNSNYISLLKNAFGDSTLNALPPSKAYGAEYLSGQLNGGTLPVMRFRGGLSTVDGKFQFPGVRLTGSDYTVFAVVKLPTLAIAYPEMFLFGTGTTQFSNLSLGFRDNIRWTMSHENYTLDAQSSTPLDQWNVVTFRFSQTDGMSIYVNNDPTPIGTDPTKTTPLTSFLGARIGSEFGNQVLMAEIRAYGSAVTPAERDVIVRSLLTKYSL
ncbi:MAG TPA: thiol-activated cytolysin family protein [candidate division Zixibacteria bacterium]|nr:thiol-activated cytolysin family protein [candidate division Zixibacteria bacterium]